MDRWDQLSEKIEVLREEGYSDDEISSVLSFECAFKSECKKRELPPDSSEDFPESY